MSSSQISYPLRLQLQTLNEKKTLSLNKGPQRERVSLEGYQIKLARNGQTLQPVISADRDDTVRSLTLWLPLSGRWQPLIKKEVKEAYSTLLLKNDLFEFMQIYMGSGENGFLHMELCRQGKAVKVCWLLDCRIKKDEELSLNPLHINLQEKKAEPGRYGLKGTETAGLEKGRILSFGPKPSLEQVRRDISLFSKKKCTFDFYLFDYGAASSWGDWDRPAPWIGDRMAELAAAVRPLGALPGIRLSPLTCARNSEFYKNRRDLLLEKGRTLKIGDSHGSHTLHPLDITKPEVRSHVDSILNYHVSRGFRFIHLDHLGFLFDRGDWSDPAVPPRQRLRLLIDIIKPFKADGVRFSVSDIPLTSQLEHFDVVFSDLSVTWKGYADLLNLAICLKNPPLLSLGRLRFASPEHSRGRNGRKRDIFLHTQALLNGPALLADETECLNDDLLETWRKGTGKRNPALLPLDISEIGLTQDVLLLVNRQKMVAILNLANKTRIVSLKEGTLAGGKGFSPSDSTSLKSNELILKMHRESSHFFRI